MRSYTVETIVTPMSAFYSAKRNADKLNRNITEVIEEYAMNGYRLVNSDSTIINGSSSTVLTNLYFEKEKEVITY